MKIPISILGLCLFLFGCVLIRYAYAKYHKFRKGLLLEFGLGIPLSALGAAILSISKTAPQLMEHLTPIMVLTLPVMVLGLFIYGLIKPSDKTANHQRSRKSDEGKRKNTEKRKRQPAYWEPKKKKRGLPPDQGGIR